MKKLDKFIEETKYCIMKNWINNHQTLIYWACYIVVVGGFVLFMYYNDKF